jgi:hypothetical protein
LNEARVESAAPIGRVFRDIDCSPTVFPAQCQALEQAEHNEDDRCRDPDGSVARQESNRRGSSAHDQQRGEEGELSSGNISDTAEYQRPERPDGESHRKGRQRLEEGRCRISPGKELGGDDRGETAEDVEIVPLDHRTDRRSGDHLPDALRLVERMRTSFRRRTGCRQS